GVAQVGNRLDVGRPGDRNPETLLGELEREHPVVLQILGRERLRDRELRDKRGGHVCGVETSGRKAGDVPHGREGAKARRRRWLRVRSGTGAVSHVTSGGCPRTAGGYTALRVSSAVVRSRYRWVRLMPRRRAAAALFPWA